MMAMSVFDMKRPLSGQNTWKRIRGMRLKEQDDACIPQALVDRSTQVMSRDPEVLDQWIDLDPQW